MITSYSTRDTIDKKEKEERNVLKKEKERRKKKKKKKKNNTISFTVYVIRVSNEKHVRGDVRLKNLKKKKNYLLFFSK